MILGIDLGTSSMKSVLVNKEGVIVHSVSIEYDIVSSQSGWAEQDPEQWWVALKKAMAQMRSIHPHLISQLQGVGMTGQMHSLVVVGQAGIPLTNAILWSDQRCHQEVSELEDRYSIEKWVKLTGNRPHVSFTLPKLLWLKRYHRDLFKQIRCFLLPKDFLRYRLTGVLATDATDASATLMFDTFHRKWSEEIISTFDIPSHIFPPLIASELPAGRLTAAAAQELGLPAGIPVMCGVGDVEAQALGNGVFQEGRWLCTIGTGGQIFTPVKNEVMDRKGRIHTLCHASNVWHIMGATLAAGSSLQWFIRKILERDEQIIYRTLEDVRNLSVPGSRGLFFLPYLFGERTPHMDETAKGAFIGLHFQHTQKDMLRAILEGVLFSLRQSMEVIQDIGLPRPTSIRFTGGAAESKAWRQIAADIFGLPVSRSNSRAGAAYGAAILAAVGCHWFPSLKKALDRWIQIKDTVYPDPQVHFAYYPYFTAYKNSYDRLKETFEEVEQTQSKCDRI